MKRLFLVFTILFCITLANAQNPFEAYGYTPKIATLSNGKYNEFHDSDTIVQIGTVLFNTQTKQIVAFLQVDTLYSEATLQPDIVSMWMSPDPLSDERPSFSPYNFCRNNPIVFVDPDGRLDDYYLNLKSGQVEYHEGSENRFDQGLVHLANDNATVGDIQDALTQRNYNYQKDPSVPGGFRVDTEKQYKGWAMMQYYSPDIVGTILFMSLGTGGSTTKPVAGTSSRFVISNSSKVILNAEQRTLQHMFSRHAKDFGVTGNWSKSMATEFERVLKTHMSGIKPIQGTWRGTTQALHYYNPSTGLNVSTTMEGNLLGGWKLGIEQIFNLLRNGNIQ